MGFYFRKSVNFGPFRVNLSKNGAGVSFGGKGLRIGVNARGKAYVHAGRGGVYYRKTLGPSRAEEEEASPPGLLPEPSSPPGEAACPSPSIPVVNADWNDLAKHLLWAESEFRRDYPVCILSILCTAAACAYLPIPAAAAVFAIGLAATLRVRRWELSRRTAALDYEFDDGQRQRFDRMLAGFAAVERCLRLWSTDGSRKLDDAYEIKTNAGADRLCCRSAACACLQPPAWVVANVDIPCIRYRNGAAYFLPDGLLLKTAREASLVEYGELAISSGIVRFIEEKAPADARVVDSVWRYMNKNGGPDRRFACNPRLPVCEYGIVVIKCEGVEVLHLMLSRPEAGKAFADSFLS